MPEIANINIQGLNTFSSRRIVGQNYLIDCNNVTVDQEGVIGTRRGQEFFGNALTSIKKIFGALSALFVNANSDLYYENAGTFTAVDFPDTATFDAETGQKIQIQEANKSLFFNGVRVSDETNDPVDKKIKKLESASGSVRNAGLEAIFNAYINTTTGATYPNNTTFAIRIFYQYTDSNGYLITSPVSDRIVALNDTGGACDFELTFQIPVQYNNQDMTFYYAISNDVISPVTPDDNLFWNEDTRILASYPINAGSSSVVTLTNFIMRSDLVNPIDLYTNAPQEGILQNNDPPLSAIDIETYNEFTFYANVKDRAQQLTNVSEFAVGADVMTLEGITYRRSTTTDYTSSPVLFEGSNVVESIYSLARAITATQTKWRARIIGEDFSNMGDAVGWVDHAVSPYANVGPSQATADDNKNIYAVFNNAPAKQFWKYNALANTWSRLADMPADIRGNSLMYVPSTNKVYSLMGLTSVNAQAPSYVYDIASNTWAVGGAPPAVTGAVAIYAGVVVRPANQSGIYYIFGSNFGGSNLPTVYFYNPSSATFLPAGTIPDVPTPGGLGREQSCGADASGNIYVFGGYEAIGGTWEVDSYELSGGTWSTIANLPASVIGMGATAVGGIIYLINGVTDLGVVIATVRTYDPSTDTYGTIADTNQVSQDSSAVNLDSVIYRVGGSDGGVARNVESYRAGGIEMMLEERFIGDETVTVPFASSAGYVTRVPYPTGFAGDLYRYEQPSVMQFSKQGQPEAVPFLNNFPVGSASYPIKRISALRTSLIILKTDGLFQLNGVSPETFSLSQLDPTFILIASQSVAKLNNEIYCLSNKGVVSINESGPKILSYKIKDLIDTALATVPQADWDTLINGTAYEDDYKYILTIGDKTFTYNYVTDQWTIWHSGDDTIASWTVFNNYLYYANDTRVLKERKTLTSADYQDENGAGLEASIEFNNLELAFGKIVTLSAMQIMQRDISNLTMAIQMNNNLGSPASYNKLLNEYVVRTLPPNGNRMAFYYRPILSWDTEIVSPGGTFSGLKIEGLDFEFTISASNIR